MIESICAVPCRLAMALSCPSLTRPVSLYLYCCFCPYYCHYSDPPDESRIQEYGGGVIMTKREERQATMGQIMHQRFHEPWTLAQKPSK